VRPRCKDEPQDQFFRSEKKSDVPFSEERFFHGRNRRCSPGIAGFLAPELREIRSRLESMDKRLDAMEDVNRIRFESVIQRLEQIQQSFAFD